MQKQTLISIYEYDFHLTQDQASDQLLASSRLLKDEIYLVDNVKKF